MLMAQLTPFLVFFGVMLVFVLFIKEIGYAQVCHESVELQADVFQDCVQVAQGEFPGGADARRYPAVGRWPVISRSRVTGRRMGLSLFRGRMGMLIFPRRLRAAGVSVAVWSGRDSGACVVFMRRSCTLRVHLLP